ncbi:hypothetical protein B1A99_11845 [Cohnella sp. CIP 111063]|jgi:hypothetical protein|uniref:hypothetical protein n=1 Tax=unclassified Cohnella TaxID=2636738 RepID=UPI000B8BE51D|nr:MULTISPECIES: hypothetical protein [unclassified Cohnella]OXS59308.1 hypothetical protein B1A99_11845 [Cohnella sp. CIP 111063]PRX72332.1 putative aldouronate transport system substrate-binding protein [Cohnella sp. SGD-V74]
MINGKKGLLFMLSIALFASILAACSGGANSPNENASPAAPSGGSEASGSASEDPFAEHMDISISHYNIGQAFPDRKSDGLLKMIEDKFNVTFVDRVVSYSDYVEKYRIWSTSGELPDVISHDIINNSTYYSWIEQGIVRALPSDLGAYPNIRKVMELEDVKGFQVDGKYYMIPRLTYNSNEQKALERALIVRKDWMEALSLPEPVTYEDYANMLAAFAKKDPNGNQKDDTIGLTARTNNMLMAVGSGSFPNVANSSWVKEDGQYIPFYASKRMDEYVTRMRELYTSGAIDPDFAIVQTNEGIEKFGQGRAGAIAMQATPSGLKLLETAWNKYNKNAAFKDSIRIYPISWETDDGSRYSFEMLSFWSETYFSANVSDKKMERIMRIYDYLLSDEYMTTNLYGLEGKDYTKEGDKYTIAREKGEDGNYKKLPELYPSLNLFGSLAAWYKWQEYEQSEIAKINLGEPVYHLVQETLAEFVKLDVIPTNLNVDYLYTEAKTKLSAVNPTEDLIKVILGKDDPVEMWRNIVKGYDNKGLQQAIKEVNEAVQAQGLDQ